MADLNELDARTAITQYADDHAALGRPVSGLTREPWGFWIEFRTPEDTRAVITWEQLTKHVQDVRSDFARRWLPKHGAALSPELAHGGGTVQAFRYATMKWKHEAGTTVEEHP